MHRAERSGAPPKGSVLLALAFALAVFAGHIALSWDSAARGADFKAYLIGSALLSQGQDPYTADRALWDRVAEERGLLPASFRYRYPIHLAWALQGLDGVSPGALWLGNALLNGLAALLGAVLIAMALGGGWNYPWAIFLVGASASIGETILLGQVTGYVLLLLAGGWLALQRSHWLGVSVFAALGTVLKLLPVVLLPIAIAWHRYRLALVAALAVLALLLLPIAFLGADHLVRFMTDTPDIVTLHELLENNQSLAAVMTRLGWPAVTINAARAALLLVLAALWLRQWREPTLLRSQALFGATLCAALLVMTTTFFIYQLWLIFPLMLLCNRLWRTGWRGATYAFLALYLLNQAIFILPQILPRALPGLFDVPQDPYGSLDFWPALYCLTLFTACAWMGLRSASEVLQEAPVPTHAS